MRQYFIGGGLGIAFLAVLATGSESANAQLPAASAQAHALVVALPPAMARTAWGTALLNLGIKQEITATVVYSVNAGAPPYSMCSTNNEPPPVETCGMDGHPGTDFTSCSADSPALTGCSVVIYPAPQGQGGTYSCGSYASDGNQNGLTSSVAIAANPTRTGYVCTTGAVGGSGPGSAFCTVNSGAGICSTWNTNTTGPAQLCSTSGPTTAQQTCSAQASASGWCSVDVAGGEHSAQCTTFGGGSPGGCSMQGTGGTSNNCSARVSDGQGGVLIQPPTAGKCVAP